MAETVLKFKRDANSAYSRVLSALETSRFKLTRKDQAIRRIQVTTGVGLLSWGVAIEIVIQPEENDGVS